MSQLFFRYVVVSLASVIALCGCSGQNESLRHEIAQLKSAIEDLRRVQAEQTSRFTALENQNRRLTGKYEELEFDQRQNITGDVDSLRENINQLRRRVPPPPIVPEIALNNDEVLAERLDGEERRLFGNALSQIRDGKYPEALDVLSELYQVVSTRELPGYLLFWRGVCLDGLGKNRDALATYHQLVQEFPEHPRAALSLLRQASVFVRLGDTKLAKLTLQKLVNEYPRAEEVALARERLRKL